MNIKFDNSEMIFLDFLYALIEVYITWDKLLQEILKIIIGLTNNTSVSLN